MFKTLRAKLFAFFLFATFVPMVMIGYVTYHSQKEDIEWQMSQMMYSFADSLAVVLEELVQERLIDVEMLAQNPILTDREQSYAEIEQEMRNFVQTHNIYVGSAYVNQNGMVVAGVNQTINGSDLSTREWFQETVGGGVYFSDVYLSPIVNRPVLALASAVRDENGEIMGVVSPSFDLHYLWDRFDKFTKQQQTLGLDGYAFLLNGQGDVIVHPNQELILNYNYLEGNNLKIKEFEQMVNERELIYSKKNKMIQTFVKLKKEQGFHHDWYMGISLPQESLAASLQELLLRYVVMFGLIFLVTMYAVYKLSAYIVQPLQQLVHATQDFAFGNKVYPLAPDAYHEVDVLTRTFNMMTKRLVEREKSYQKSSLILETTDNGIMAFNKDSQRITTFNRTCEQLFKVNKDDVIGMKLDHFIHSSPIFNSFITSIKLPDMLNLNEIDKRFEFTCVINEQERVFFISVSTLPKLDNEQELEDILLIFNDVTDKREMERELIRTEKLKVIGQLSAGFAHEIRNPLTTIRGFMQLLYQSKNVSKEKQSHYHIMLKEIDRIDGIISDLLNMASPKVVMVKSEVDIAELMQEIAIFYATEAKEKQIELKTTIEPLPLIYIDERKFHQAMINVIKNGFEAMPDGGILNIHAMESINSESIHIHITDNGVGMSEQTVEKLGTPFYTTKETGTGLGMMTTFQIIEEMGGSLTVTSVVGEGTTFTIKLPLE